MSGFFLLWGRYNNSGV